MKQSKFYTAITARKRRRLNYLKSLYLLIFSFLTSVLIAQQDTTILEHTGAPQTWTVPAGVTEVSIIAAGAQGGSPSSQNAGYGFRVKGNLAVNPGDVLHVYVGGEGDVQEFGNFGGGGWNGGGDARGGFGTTALGAGGGGSDVRVGGTTLNHRVIVAGGGGGSSISPKFGGDGGALYGAEGIGGAEPGLGGSPFSGGDGACFSGELGKGGSSGTTTFCSGGGGGYYGGGSGSGAGAGGGSSYIGGVTNGEYLSGLRNGDGLVTIIWSQGPVNDLCEYPLPIGCDYTIFGNTESASPDNPPCRGISGTGGGVWYRFLGTGEDVILSTCHPGTNFDTYLSVFNADCNEPICIASNDNSTDCNDAGKSELSFFAAAGGVYKILVDGPNGAIGNFQLTLTCGSPCENAIDLTCNTFAISGTTENALIGSSPICGSIPNGRGNWYKISGDGYCHSINTCYTTDGITTDFDVQLSVFEGSCLDLVCVAYNDDKGDCTSAHSGSAKVDFNTEVGTDYYVLVHGKNDEVGNYAFYHNCQTNFLSLESPNFGTVYCGDPWPAAIDNQQDFVDAGGYITTDECSGGPFTFSNTDVPFGDCDEEGQLRFTRIYYITDESSGITESCEQNFYCAANDDIIISCPEPQLLVCGQQPPSPANTIAEFEALGGIVSGGCQLTGIFSDDEEFECNSTGDVVLQRQYVVSDANGNSGICIQEFYCTAIPALEVSCPADITLDCGEDIPPAAGNILEFMDIGGTVTGGMCENYGYNASYRFTLDEFMEGDACDGMTVTRVYIIYSYLTEELEYCEHQIHVPAIGVPTLTTQPPVEIECIEDLVDMDLYSLLTITFPEGTCQGNSTTAYSDIPDAPILNCGSYPISIEFGYFGECGIEVYATQEFVIVNNGVQVEFSEDTVVECSEEIQVSPADVTVSTPCGLGDPQIVILGPELVQGTGNDCSGSVYKVRYSFSDACNGFHEHERFFTVQNEGTQVIVAPDMEVECEDDIEVSEDDVVITSPCGHEFEAEYDSPEISDPSHPNCSGVTHTYKYYFTDECGVFHEYYRTFTIQNKELTLIPVDPDLTRIENGDIVSIQCQSNTDDWALPQFDVSSFDFEAACNLEADIEYTFEDLGAANCEIDGYAHAYSYSWTVEDECQSEETFSFIIRVVDEIDPILNGVPADITLECNDELPLPPSVTATDECECADMFYKEEVLTDGICSGNSIVLRTWTAKDCCGNEVSQSQRITVEDKTAPEVTYNGEYENEIISGGGITLECSEPAHENWLYSLDENSISVIESCSEDVNIVYSLHGYSPQSCAVAGFKDEWEPTWTVTDDCGNSTTFSFIVRMEDNTAPYLLKSDVLYLCENDQEGFAWVEDQCSNALWNTTEELVEGCGEGIFYRIYEMEDECGNTSTDQQLVIDLNQKPDLINLINPVELPLYVYCGEDSKVEEFGKTSVTSIVECIPDIEIAFYEYKNSNPCVDGSAQMEYLWTATTPCGYVDSLVVTATLIDEEPPIFQNMSDTITVSCIDAMPAVIATDECSDVEVEVQTNTSEWGCISEGAIERIITATDACGNKSQMTQMVYIIDEVGPVFNEENVICYSENNENLTAYDKCNGALIEAELTESERTFCGNYAIIVNTYTATDACGNGTTFTQQVFPDEFEIEILVLDENLESMDANAPNVINESDFANYNFIYALDDKSVIAETPCQIILDAEFESTVRFNQDCEGGISRIYYLSWTFKSGCTQEQFYEVEIHVKSDDFLEIELEDVDPIYCHDEIPELVIENEVEEFDYRVDIDDQRDGNGDGQVIRTVRVTDNCGNESSATQEIQFYNSTDMTCEIDGDFAPACNTGDNYYTVFITGGTAPYTVEWTANGGDCSIEWAEGETANINIGFGQANISVRVTDVNGCVTTCEAEVSCLGMMVSYHDNNSSLESSEVQEEENITTTNQVEESVEEINVYPNPFRNDVKIEIPEAYEVERIEVIDASGAVYVAKKIDTESKEVILNLNELNSGVYFILMTTQKEIITKKVVRL